MGNKSESTGRSKRSRRELLAGAAGAAGVIAAQTVIGARPAYAGTDGDVVLGTDDQSTAGTTGVSSSAITGLHGRSTAAGGTGVFGEDLATGGVGVHGNAGDIGVRGDGDTGVRGEGTTYGVFGDGGPSVGVRGLGGNVGVSGHSDDITGVYGEGGLIGVHAVSTGFGGAGVGLRVDGRSVFRTAGVATVASGKRRVIVKLAGVTPSDMVPATVQQKGGFFVKNAVARTDKFTIRLNKAPASRTKVKVAWFVLSAS